MKKFYFILFLISFTAFGQERVNATLPAINPIASGRLTEATGWMQNDAGEWLSRKNRIPDNLSGQDKVLLDYQFHGLGNNRENFIYIEAREVIIKDSAYTILIKKHKDGYYQYESISKGWTPQNSLIYYVIHTSDLNKLKNLEADKLYNFDLEAIYTNDILYLDPKSSLNTVAAHLAKTIKDKSSYDDKKVRISIKLYKNNVRFFIGEYDKYLDENLMDKYYYETTLDNFTKLFKLK